MIRKKNINRKDMCRNHKKLLKKSTKNKKVQKKHSNKRENRPKRAKEMVRKCTKHIFKRSLKAKNLNIVLNAIRLSLQVALISKKNRPHSS